MSAAPSPRTVALDPVAVSAMFAANRIAVSLENIASLATDPRFLLEGEALDSVIGVTAAVLYDWILSFDEAARPADLRAGTRGIALEAEALWQAIRSHRGQVRAIARRARTWADTVCGWCATTGALAR